MAAAALTILVAWTAMAVGLQFLFVDVVPSEWIPSGIAPWLDGLVRANPHYALFALVPVAFVLFISWRMFRALRYEQTRHRKVDVAESLIKASALVVLPLARAAAELATGIPKVNATIFSEMRFFLIVYLDVVIVASAIAFLMFGSDKYRAIFNRWRIPEKRLHFWEIMGGWPGAWAAQHVFAHKLNSEYQPVFRRRILYHVALVSLAVAGWLWAEQTGGASEFFERARPVSRLLERFL